MRAPQATGGLPHAPAGVRTSPVLSASPLRNFLVHGVAQLPQKRPPDAAVAGGANAISLEDVPQVAIRIPPAGAPRMRPFRDLRRRQHLHAASEEGAPSATLNRPTIEGWPWRSMRGRDVTDVGHIWGRSGIRADIVQRPSLTPTGHGADEKVGKSFSYPC
jgi:hypothetical protein